MITENLGRAARTALRATVAGAAALALLATGQPAEVAAQTQPIVYPSGGQSRAQQAQDEAECRVFAQQQSGFDPFAWGPNVPQGAVTGDVVGGAAGGAALGAVGGAIGGRAGRGAAIGAGVGAAAGLMRRGARAEQTRADQQRSQAEFNRQAETFNRAFATCMRGRGYTVS